MTFRRFDPSAYLAGPPVARAPVDKGADRISSFSRFSNSSGLQRKSAPIHPAPVADSLDATENMEDAGADLSRPSHTGSGGAAARKVGQEAEIAARKADPENTRAALAVAWANKVPPANVPSQYCAGCGDLIHVTRCDWVSLADGATVHQHCWKTYQACRAAEAQRALPSFIAIFEQHGLDPWDERDIDEAVRMWLAANAGANP
jgi:hypothetical protein